MNLTVENSLAAWLRSLDAFEGLAIHTGQSNDEIPGDQPVIIAGVSTNDILGASLYRLTATIVLATPSAMEGGLETHAALSGSLRTAIFSAATLGGFFEAPQTLAGAVATSFNESQESDRWTSTMQIALGVSLQI